MKSNKEKLIKKMKTLKKCAYNKIKLTKHICLKQKT